MSQLVAAARRYLGVPFRHRGRTPRGLDCVGLPWLAYCDSGVRLPDYLLYQREPNPAELVRRLSIALGEPVAVAPITQALLSPGDIVLMVLPLERHPHHVGIVSDYPYGGALGVIHASGEVEGSGRAGRVVEHRMDAQFIRRITHVFRKPI